jgi:anti-sigma regulatory factor (Ser/Thr protein kinase)
MQHKLRKKEREFRSRLTEILSELEAPSNISKKLGEEMELSNAQITRYFKKAYEDGLIEITGYGKGKKYSLSKNTGSFKKIFSMNALKTSSEDEIYNFHIEPALENCSKNLKLLTNHCCTEMINNVIDHSNAKKMTLSIFISNKIEILIEDDGIGVFESVKSYFKLNNYFEGLAEISKGKRTTDQKNHAGEGIFFSQRMCDQFTIEANGHKYEYDSEVNDWSASGAFNIKGSKVTLIFDSNTQKTPEEIFEKYTNHDFAFVHSDGFNVKPYILSVSERMVSRSEAKKLLAGAQKFNSITINFAGADGIGQGFADEIFRVFSNRYPNISLDYTNANSAINNMIQYVLKNLDS